MIKHFIFILPLFCCAAEERIVPSRINLTLVALGADEFDLAPATQPCSPTSSDSPLSQQSSPEASLRVPNLSPSTTSEEKNEPPQLKTDRTVPDIEKLEQT